jgi:hypothetical protein
MEGGPRTEVAAAEGSRRDGWSGETGSSGSRWSLAPQTWQRSGSMPSSSRIGGTAGSAVTAQNPEQVAENRL